MKSGLPRPLHVALDGTPLLETCPTGVARAFRAWLNALPHTSHPVRLTVFVPGARGTVEPPEGVEVIRLAGGPRYRWVELPRALAGLRPHLFHSPFLAVPPANGVPMVATAHEVPQADMVRAEGFRRTLGQVAWWSLCRRCAHGLVAVSAFTAREARRGGWRGKPLGVAPHGIHVDTDPIDPFPRTGPVVGVGVVRPKKGIALGWAGLQDAYSRLASGPARGPSRRPLLWIGGGVRPGTIRSGVHYLGYQPDPVVGAWLRRAACLVVPSVTEGFGMTALEAMAAGCPVVVARAGALPEVVGPAGWVVDRPSPAAWGRVLARVLAGGPEVVHRVEAGRARAARFTWSRAAERLIRVYAAVWRRSQAGD